MTEPKDKRFPLPLYAIPLALRGGIEEVLLGTEPTEIPNIELPSRERRKSRDQT